MRRISSFFKVGRWILLSQSYEISRQTAHYFMQKVREAMKSSESHKMNDRVQLAEYSFRINRSQNKDTIFIKVK